MSNIYIVIALVAANESWGAVHELSGEQKKAASLHVMKQKRPLHGITGLPDGVRAAFMLLAWGYQETGSCVADVRTDAEVVLESLRSPTLPTVIIKLVLDYFASVQDSESISKIFEDNWWSLFEKHIGNPSLCSDEVVVSPEASELFKRKIQKDDINDWVEKRVIVSCLRDLQVLAELGLAYNPYAYVIRHQTELGHLCPSCGIELIFADFENSWLGLSGKKFWRQDISPVQALVNSFAPSHRIGVNCGKCGTCSFVTAQSIITQRPQLFMAVAGDDETFMSQEWHDAPEKLEHSGAAFELFGLTMRHYYGAKEYFYLHPAGAYPNEQRVVYQRGFFHSYHTQQFGFVAEDYLKGLGGTFATQAMLYRYVDTKPRSPARDTTTCRCIIS